MLIKDVYFKVLDLLDKDEYKLRDISKELGIGIDVVKKVSQMRTVRLQFEDMSLTEIELKFLNDLWFNIVYLKEVSSKEDIKDIIELLQDFNEVNKREILIARGCLEQKKKRIKEYKDLIDSNERAITRLSEKLEELKQEHKEYKERVKSILKAIESYPETKREYIFNLLGFFDTTRARFSSMNKNEYLLVMKPVVSQSKFRELKNSRAIEYDRYDYYCKILDLNKFLDIMTKGNCKLGKKMNSKIFDFNYDYVLEKKREVQKELKGKQKDLEGYKSELNKGLNLKLSEVFDEVEEDYLKIRNLFDKHATFSIDVECDKIESHIKEYNGIYAKNLFDIDKKHYVSYSEKGVALYVIMPEYCTRYSYGFHYFGIKVFKEDIVSNIDNSIKYIINKLKHSVDEIYMVHGNNIELYYEEPLSENKRELTKFNICRKLNKDFLFLK